MTSVPEALLAVRPGMPARRTAEQRTARTGRSAVEAGAAALRNPDDFVRCGFIDRIDRHRLGGRRHQAETNGKRRCNKPLHGLFLSS